MAKEKKFLRGDAVHFGWEVTKNNLLFLVLIVLITWAISAVFSVPNMAAGRYFFIYPFFGLISFVISIFVNMAYVRIGLRFVGGETAEFSDLWASYPLFFKYLVGSILYGLIVLAGLILLIIPGIIWGIKYQFFGYFIVDKEMPPVEALKRSGEITKGSKWNLFVLALAFLGITILGAIACGVGLLLAIPTVFVAHAWVYRRLETQTPSPMAVPIETAAPVTPTTPPAGSPPTPTS